MARPAPTDFQIWRTGLSASEPGCFLLIIELSASERVLFTDNNAPIEYEGDTYQPFPFVIGGLQESMGASLPSTSVSASNADRLLSKILEEYDGLQSRSVTLLFHISVNDVQSVVNYGTFYVKTSAYNDSAATLNVGGIDIMRLGVPHETYTRDFCPFPFKGNRCKYSGPLTTCNRLLRVVGGCAERDNIVNNGSFPGILRGV